MSYRFKYFLLPFAGALSAFISFLIASPYVKSLHRPWLKDDDPVAHFTYGTVWTNVQHCAFGALLCGSFCFILEYGRRTPRRVLLSTIFGAILGAIANGCADSGADLIGINAMRKVGATGQGAGAIAWFILVPAALSFAITIAVGPTKQRIIRACFATVVAAVFTFIGRMIGDVVGAAILFTRQDIMKLATDRGALMEASIPAWLAEAVAVGIALGLTMMIADQVSRKGTLRLVYGRKEFNDWSLDHIANRIGSGEVEIPVRGFKGVEPVHSCIFRQGHQFIFDSQYAPATINGYPVQQAALSPGDTIQIGEAVLVFLGQGSAARHPVQPMMAPIAPVPTPQPAPVVSVPVASVPVKGAAPNSSYFLSDDFGREFVLLPGTTTVGREVGNQICLTHESTVSRNHAEIHIDPNGVTLRDVGSANGTRVNGNLIDQPVHLSSGDVVAFGKATMRFRVTS